MKKNLLIGLLIVVSLASLAFGFFQKVEAKRQQAIAEANAEIAREAVKEAEKQRDIATMEHAKAVMARTEAAKQKELAEQERELALSEASKQRQIAREALKKSKK